MRRIITVILVLSIVFAMATPTFAYEETKHQDNIADGNHTLPISVVTVDNGNFYIEETDAYRLVVGIVGEKVDCSVCYFSAPNVVHSLNELRSDDYKGKDDKEIFAYYKQLLLDSKIPTTTLTIKKEVSLLSSNGERSNLKDVFLNILYSRGEPTPHSQMEIYHGWRNGIKCTAYRTLTYNAYEYTTWHLLGDMTLSQILSICAIGQVSLFAVLKLAYNALRGDWVLEGDTCLYEYNIYAHYTKNMKINNAVWYTASRTVFWKGYSGSEKDEVTLMSDTKHFAYDDNPQLIDLAFNSYFGE